MKAIYNFRDFQSALKRVAPACSRDEFRPTLQCVYVVGTQAQTRIIAADGFRAAFLKIAPALEGQVFTALIDPTAVKSLLKVKIVRGDDPEITLDTESNHIVIDGKPQPGGFVEATYPDVDQVRPQNIKTSVTVNPADLLQACKTARVFAREGCNVVQFHITDSLLVRSKSEEFGESVTVVTPEKVLGEPLAIGFNADFLIDYLKICNPAPIILEFGKANGSAEFTDSDGLQYVIMPMVIEPNPGVRGVSDIKTADSYNPAGSYVFPESYYTNRHPCPQDPDGWVPSWYTKPEPRDQHPESVTVQPAQLHDEYFTPQPAPGALDWEFQSSKAEIVERTPAIALTMGNPTPCPDAPLPVDLSARVEIPA